PCGEIEGAAVHDELVSREVDDRHVHLCESDDIVFSFSERELTVRSIRYPRAGHHDRFRDQVGGVGSGLGQRLDMEHADVLLEPGVHLGIAGSFGPGDEGPNPDRDHKQAYSNGAKEYPDDDHPYGPLRKRHEVLLDLLTDLFTHSWLPPYYDVLAIIDLDHEKSHRFTGSWLNFIKSRICSISPRSMCFALALFIKSPGTGVGTRIPFIT